MGTDTVNFFSTYGIFIILIIAMFAIMIIPQRRRDKKIKAMLAALKPGDRVRTIGGIYGTISSVRDDVIILPWGPTRSNLCLPAAPSLRWRIPAWKTT